jgi:hypothetical protein
MNTHIAVSTRGKFNDEWVDYVYVGGPNPNRVYRKKPGQAWRTTATNKTVKGSSKLGVTAMRKKLTYRA